jgi:hypothetical protein
VEGWMAQSLSFAGRLELIKSVLFNILAYWYLSYDFPISIIQEVERILANFLWKGRMHTMSWNDICKPKSEGGFGLRRVKDVCDAAGVKKIWRLLNFNTLWSDWLRRRYLHNANFWEASIHLLDSGTWKHLIALKPQAMAYMRKQIGNGKDTSIWFDPWLDEGRLSELLPQGVHPHISYMNDWKVDKLLLGNQWSLSIPILISFWPTISSISVSSNEDCWRWTTAWDNIREHSVPFTYFTEVWFPSNSPKMACCLLKGLLDRLPTLSRLRKFHIINSDRCVLCDDGQENIQHLYFECSFSKYLWSLCKLKLSLHHSHIGSLIQEADVIRDKFKARDKTYKLARLAFNATVWHIWQERNRRIFQRAQLHKVMVFRNIYEDIKLLLRTCTWKVNHKDDILSNWGL